ncbi:fatty acid CoA ligase family protein [Calycomorphotria hydatis]|uniref:4-chlorobenzoate--CoA ligase n=1 Tax=Calycomorphotria hydatis TaxID=2528027 RepID=A0A517T951_9PLAN|nr:fatty acid CoA ligase family protein [Calycomorphotria hydatis]QDT64912.1 4-chlorobenzoate--CoA ligase [Calycomorphotria hydatis]
METEQLLSPESSVHTIGNISQLVRLSAKRTPHQPAIIQPVKWDALGRPISKQITFEKFDQEIDALAVGLAAQGINPGDRIVLMVKSGIDFISLTFALFRAGAVIVLIDPGMGLKSVFKCLDEINPDGFVAIPAVHIARKLRWGAFPNATKNVSAGSKVFDAVALKQVAETGRGKTPTVETQPTDPAAIIFTSGSTGPAKGVCYQHGMFAAQAELIRRRFDIQPGEVDLPCFPLFGLFNAAMGVTTIIPEMNPTRPADVDPAKIVRTIQAFGVTQAFGSPAVWNRVGPYSLQNNITLPTVKRILSAGAPVPIPVLENMLPVLTHPEADIFTPYGATESLPIAAIGAKEVLSQTRELTQQGRGTCVGRLFDDVEVRIIKPSLDPINYIEDTLILPTGEVGEIIVRSPSTTLKYDQREKQTTAAKIRDGEATWHRMGDMGYFDKDGRLWFCGRKPHVVHTETGPLYSVCCEAPFNCHPDVFRSALVGVGEPGKQTPVVVVEPNNSRFPNNKQTSEEFSRELREIALRHDHTKSIEQFLFHHSLPVDIRHNVKINRELLADWAAKRL